MKLYTSKGAANPRRVVMFLAEKGVRDIPTVEVNLLAGEHESPEYRSVNPLARVPALELDDGRILCESRAICTYVEGLHPDPNLMGRSAEERAFIEMWDRRVEWHFFLPVAMWVRHSHPALVSLEQLQLPDYARTQEARTRETARWLDSELAERRYVAGERFTIADITAFVALEFARLVKFRAGEAGLPHLHRWREEMVARPSASASSY
ncbi:MAG: glutathione S-transferase family protein [Steroidobacteraceae bacterium]